MGRWWERTLVVCILCSLSAGVAPGGAQEKSSPKPLSIGAQAVGAVLKHYALNPQALNPKTGQPLSTKGTWSAGKTRPAACPQTEETCVAVFYAVDTEAVRCSWVVLLNADGTDGKFLDENDDAERYMAPTVLKSEASGFVDSRKKPIYPAIAVAADVSGAVVLNVVVGKTGEVLKARVASGPPMLQSAALEAARGWKFKPMTVGSRAVPYEIELKFSFRTMNGSMAVVSVAP